MLKNKKTIILSLLVVIVLFVGLELFQVTNFVNFRSRNTEQSQGPTQQELEASAETNAAAKERLIENQTKDSDGVDPNTTPTSQNIGLSAQQESNSSVTVFTKLVGYSSGSCELQITNAGQSVTQTATVFYQAEYSTCAGFSIPTDPLGKGLWSLKLTVTSNGKSESNTLLYEVK